MSNTGVKLRGPKSNSNDRVNGDIVPDAYVPGLKSGATLERTNGIVRPTWMQYLLAPFYDEYPGIVSLILVAVQIILFTFLAGIFVGIISDKVASDINATPSMLRPATGSIIIAFVQAALIWVFAYATREKKWPVFILPEQYFTMVVTGKYGLLTAIGSSGLCFVGYTIAGFTLRSLVSGYSPNRLLMQPMTNVATSSLSYVLYWIGSSAIQFVWLWSSQFKNDSSEKDSHLYNRGIKVLAGLTFACVLVFYGPTPGHGLVVMSPGLYLTGLIYSNVPGRSYAGDPVNPWATFMFVGLLAVPATAWVLYLVLGWHASYMVIGDRDRKARYSQYNDEARERSKLNDTRLADVVKTAKTGRNVVVEY